MSEQFGGMLLKVEIFIIGGFFILFMIWVVFKCVVMQEAYEEQVQQEVIEEVYVDFLCDVGLVGDYMFLDIIVKFLKNLVFEVESVELVIFILFYVIIFVLNMCIGLGFCFKIMECLEFYDELQFLGEVIDMI